MAILAPEPSPLARDGSGVIRIAGTRVSLESLVSAYRTGPSIENLKEAFPDLSQSDIHMSVAYYLSHRQEVEEYLAERQHQAEAVEAEIREQFPEAYQRVTPSR